MIALLRYRWVCLARSRAGLWPIPRDSETLRTLTRDLECCTSSDDESDLRYNELLRVLGGANDATKKALCSL